MRAKLALIPLVAGLALLGGCATQNGTSTPTTPAVTTPAGNGVDKLTADEILAKAQAAFKAKKAHVVGTANDDGEKTDIDFVFANGNAGGSIKSAQLSVGIVAIGDDLYLKAPDEFLTMLIQDPALLAAAKGKYVKLNGKNPNFATFKDIADTDEVLAAEGTYTKGTAKTINGVPTIGLVDDKKKTTLYIATEGDPLPIQAEGPDGAVLKYEYKDVADIKAPAATDVYDLSKVLG